MSELGLIFLCFQKIKMVESWRGPNHARYIKYSTIFDNRLLGLFVDIESLFQPQHLLYRVVFDNVFNILLAILGIEDSFPELADEILC